MRKNKKQGIFVFILFFLISVTGIPAGNATTFYGEAKTGLQELKDFRYPVFLYVPENYKPTSRAYTLVIVLPNEGQAPDKAMDSWLKIAKKKSLIVLSPELKMRLNDVPYQTDAWFLNMKKDILGRYRISPDKIYLVGNGAFAHYAAYLGLKYPEQFSAAALLGTAWNGPLEKIMPTSRRPKKQVPFFVALPGENSDLIKKTEDVAYKLTAKGYPVYLEKLEAGKDDTASQEFQKRLLDWLDEKSQSWAKVKKESQKKLKEKMTSGVEGFFETT